MFTNLLNIEKVERKIFHRHFIRNVILEFNFDCLEKDIIINKIKYLTEKFNSIGFTKFDEIKQIEFKMTTDKDIPEHIIHDNETIGLLFLNDEQKIRIELLENKLIINIFKYLCFENFIDQVKIIIEIINSLRNENNNITRIALRKENAIISTETNSFENIIEILNPPLLSMLRGNTIPFETFDFCQDEFRVIKNELKCRVSSTCMRKAEDEFEINLNILVVDDTKNTIDDLSKKLKEINDFNFSIFCWATTDKFKNIMNEVI